MTDLTLRLIDLAKEATNSDEDPHRLAEKAVRSLGSAKLRELAIREVAGWIERHRRDQARETERAASAQRHAEEQAHRARLAPVERKSRYEAWLEEPSLLDWERESKSADNGQPTVFINAAERKAFMRWLGDRYDDWYARGVKASQAAKLRGEYGKNPNHGHVFESDFYKLGASEWIARRRWEQTMNLVREVEAETRLEVTRELLETVFALGDGSKTTWGAATVEQHEQRLDMLVKNAGGIIETAALHSKAIDMLRSAGISCLNELEQPEAAAA